MHCAAGRRSELHVDTVNGVLDAVTLVDVTRGDVLRAATSSWGLRSADSVHLAAALRMECDVMVTYGAELTVASTRAGFRVEAPI